VNPSIFPSSFVNAQQKITPRAKSTPNDVPDTEAHTGAVAQISEETTSMDQPSIGDLSRLSSHIASPLKSPDTIIALNRNESEFSPKKTIYIVLNRSTKEKIMVDRESGTILSDILTIRKRFRRIISFNPETLTDAKHEFFLSEVGYWLPFTHKVIYIFPGATSRLLIKQPFTP
jgi:hypothetical protein